MKQKPFLNLGCGRIILPAPQPSHHGLVEATIYDYPLWVNVDRNACDGVEVVDLFEYPWPWPSNSFDGALLSHLVEHIPHEIKIKPSILKAGWDEKPIAADGSARINALLHAQDGWYAFFAELHRVLTPNARAHILSPYGWSAGAITDPTHTRLITEHTFTHSMAPDPDSPFQYATLDTHFQMTRPASFRINQLYAHLLPVEGDNEEEVTRKTILLQGALATQLNVAYDLYVILEAVKDEGNRPL